MTARPHIRVRLSDPDASRTVVEVVANDTVLDISSIVRTVRANLTAGHPASVDIEVLFADLSLIGFAPEDRLRQLVSLGKAAQRMLGNETSPLKEGHHV